MGASANPTIPKWTRTEATKPDTIRDEPITDYATKVPSKGGRGPSARRVDIETHPKGGGGGTPTSRKQPFSGRGSTVIHGSGTKASRDRTRASAGTRRDTTRKPAATNGTVDAPNNTGAVLQVWDEGAHGEVLPNGINRIDTEVLFV